MFKDTKIIFYINRDNECTKSFSQNKNILEIRKLLNSLCTCDQSVLQYSDWTVCYSDFTCLVTNVVSSQEGVPVTIEDQLVDNLRGIPRKADKVAS